MTPPPTALTLAQQEFAPRTVYLNTASMGLPPRRSLVALQAALDGWRDGTASPPDYDAPLDASRTAYAALVGVPVGDVAVGSQVSAFVGLVAASLPGGSEVLVATDDFTSVVFPFLAAQERGVIVREAPLDRLLDAVTPATTLVAVSAVQSADGRIADLDGLASLSAGGRTRVLLDTTQATGWLPIDAGRYDYTVNGGYKWLLNPRGTCFCTVRPEQRADLTPVWASWYAGVDPWASLYGTPLRLAPDARRYDLSPVWHAWVGAAPALQLLTSVGIPALHAHAVGLANRFRAAVNLPPGDSAIVSLPTDDALAARLAAAKVVGSVRAGRLRLAFHLSTTEADVDAAAAVVRPV